MDREEKSEWFSTGLNEGEATREEWRPLKSGPYEVDFLEFNDQVHSVLEEECRIQGKHIHRLSESFALAIESWCETYGSELLGPCLGFSVGQTEGGTLEFQHLPEPVQGHLLDQLVLMNDEKLSQNRLKNLQKLSPILH